MSYQALYRKYRPCNFEDFIDQDNVKTILVNSVLNNKISHAYLFSGPRGIGKTSMAKIFAKAINCENFKEKKDVCDHCKNCQEVINHSVDIIEIDAASNNGVDQIRDLKDKIAVVPSKLKYKVYIIDEVHMLTNSAFNALLKTLEEPPSHAVFILATTEFYEVPETIVSRCQCFSFSRITEKSLISRLKMISDRENIDIDSDALEEIAHFSNGGLRDAIGMLDKLHAFTNDKITVDVFKNINGMISQSEIVSFYNSILDYDNIKVLEMIEKVDINGYDYKNFIERVMLYVRDCVVDYYISKKEIKGLIDENIDLINTLNDILVSLKESLNPQVIVQINILRFINDRCDCDNKTVQDNTSEPKIISREIEKKSEKAPKMVENAPKTALNTSNLQIDDKIKKIRINNALATASISFKKNMQDSLTKLPDYFMDSKYGKVSQLLVDAVPMVVGAEYIIFTVNTMGLMNNLYSSFPLVEEFITEIYGNKMKLVFVLNSEFNEIKQKYIEDKKNNIIYHVQEECGKLVCDKSNLLNQAINLFGSEYVEIE